MTDDFAQPNEPDPFAQPVEPTWMGPTARDLREIRRAIAHGGMDGEEGWRPE